MHANRQPTYDTPSHTKHNMHIHTSYTPHTHTYHTLPSKHNMHIHISYTPHIYAYTHLCTHPTPHAHTHTHTLPALLQSDCQACASTQPAWLPLPAASNRNALPHLWLSRPGQNGRRDSLPLGFATYQLYPVIHQTWPYYAMPRCWDAGTQGALGARGSEYEPS